MTKIISLSDEAYERLLKLKNGLSFSKTVLKLTAVSKKANLLDVISRLKADEGLAGSIEKSYKKRKLASVRSINF